MPGPAGGWDVTDPAPPGTTEPPPQRLARGIARGAAIVAGLTLASRLLGLVRTVVFSQTVGAGCLGTAYVTASNVPNLVYEVVLGGALTTAMVPVLARWAERSGADPEAKAQVSQITSALMTWTLIILVPLTIVVAAAAGPIASLLNPANPHAHCVHASVVSTTRSMLVVFAPQIILFGVSVAGVVVSVALPVSHKVLDVGVAVVAAGVAVLVFGGVAYLLDQGDLRAIAVRLRRMAGAGGRSPDEPGGPPGSEDPPPG